jgi:hypothetical protein
MKNRPCVFSSAKICANHFAPNPGLMIVCSLPVPPTVILSSLMVGMPTPTGTDWPSLPQVPMPSSSFEIVADHGDVFEGFGAVADEGGVADGGGDFAVFDEVGLGGGEDEFAVGDVDLAAAEVDGVEAALDGADDVFGRRRRRACRCWSCAAWGWMVALAAAGAGVGAPMRRAESLSER